MNRYVRTLTAEPFWLFVYGFVFLFGLARFFGLTPEGTAGRWSWSHCVDALRLPWGILTAALFVHIFSDPIPLPPAERANEDEQRDYRQRRSLQRRTWMIFSYSFMLVSLLVPVYTFSTGWHEVERKGARDLDHPIAVFVGCSLDDMMDKKKELSCFSTKQQTEPTPQAEAQKQTEDQKKRETRIETEARKTVEAQAQAKTQQPAEVTREASAPTGSAWVINLGGHVTNASVCGKDNSATACQVRGGLLVPLYVVILALMGGSISLTRRLPEYQKRANPEYVSTEEEPKLSQHEFREYLVFQIAQFVSAPLIAVLAYYLIEPSTRQASVALAFTAGFSSETILLMVRAVTEKVSPTSAQPKSGTITGIITLDAVPAKNAEVALTASSHVRAVADDNGVYVLGNVPIGEHGITVSPASTADNVEAITGSVKVERAQEVVKRHWKLAKKKT